MSVSDTKKCTKTAVIYGTVSVLCVVVANVYALFGHRVRSLAMDLLFLYPLLGGALLFAALKAQRRRQVSRLAYNLYSAGVALLAVSSLLRGIVEIAGTRSRFVGGFLAAGCLSVLTGIVVYLWLARAGVVSSLVNARGQYRP